MRPCRDMKSSVATQTVSTHLVHHRRMVAPRCGCLVFVRGHDTLPQYRLLRPLSEYRERGLPHACLVRVERGHVSPSATAPHEERAVVPDCGGSHPRLGERIGCDVSRGVWGQHPPSLREDALREIKDVECASWRGVATSAGVYRRARGELAGVNDEEAGIGNCDGMRRAREEGGLGKKKPMRLGHR